MVPKHSRSLSGSLEKQGAVSLESNPLEWCPAGLPMKYIALEPA